MSGNSRPLCKKCFFEEIDPKGIFSEIKDLISVIPQDQRADENEYRRRLNICGACEFLGEGTCGKCGCFVELRAAKLRMGCPHEKHYW